LEAVGEPVKGGAVDVLIVGAGPTGLTLAAQKRVLGVLAGGKLAS
jgi:hypothetical protein